MTFAYVSRDMWGGGPIKSGHKVPLAQFIGLVVHHTVIVMPDYDYDNMVNGDVDDVCRYMRQLQHARPDLGDEVPYSFVVFEGEHDNDVIVAEGRGLGITGAHTIEYNSTRYGCAFAGDYTNHAPTVGMWNGVNWVGSQLVKPRAPDAMPTIEHRDVYATQCPGNMTPTPAIAQPPFLIPSPPTTPTPTPFHQQKEDDTMVFAYKGSQYLLHMGKVLVSSSDLAPGVKLPNLDDATFNRIVKQFGPAIT